MDYNSKLNYKINSNWSEIEIEYLHSLLTFHFARKCSNIYTLIKVSVNLLLQTYVRENISLFGSYRLFSTHTHSHFDGQNFLAWKENGRWQWEWPRRWNIRLHMLLTRDFNKRNLINFLSLHGTHSIENVILIAFLSPKFVILTKSFASSTWYFQFIVWKRFQPMREGIFSLWLRPVLAKSQTKERTHALPSSFWG